MARFESSVDSSPDGVRVSLDAGTGWRATSVPDTALALVKMTEPGSFEPNVAVFVTKHSPDFDAREIIDDLDPQRLDMPDLAAQAPFERTIGGVEFVGRAVAFRDAAAGTLAQVHLVTKVERPDAADVVHVVGTCGGNRVPVDLPALTDVMGTVHIDVDG